MQIQEFTNIIFILADDPGLDCVSCYGADKHRTPHIDKLAVSGTRCELNKGTDHQQKPSKKPVAGFH